MHHDVAAAVERVAFVVGRRAECDAVAEADRQLAVASDGGAGVGIDAGCAVARITLPWAERERAERKILGERIPRRAEADEAGDEEGPVCVCTRPNDPEQATTYDPIGY